MSDWRTRAGTTFAPEKASATSTRGMVVTNHPLASAAGAEMLAAGGNAVDAAVAALFALSVVEPMMVGLIGGGIAHIRRPDGTHLVVDSMATAPGAATPDMFEPVTGPAQTFDVVGRANAVGAKAVATPGTLLGWCDVQARFGKLSRADVMEPAIRHAARGFAVTPYLSDCIAEAAADIRLDGPLTKLLLEDGAALRAGARLVQGAAADTLRAIAAEGPDVVYHGAIGAEIVTQLQKLGGVLDRRDLARYALVDRQVVRGTYRGHEIVGPPPPASGGVHVLQMLNILAHIDMRSLGYGTADSLHLIAEALKIAFADRAVATADPAFVDVPVDRLISKAYAADRFAAIDPNRAQRWSAGVAARESPHTTHVTVADAEGTIVASTQTINSVFGARILIPSVGLIPNNYMFLYDPRPGRTLSIAPGKRITSSMAPLMILRDGKPAFALGLPGGLRIFGSAMQAVLNLIDHGMSLQEAVEAPRLWTMGGVVEVEEGIGADVRAALAARGHEVVPMPHVAGGMNAIAFGADGAMTGAACWRADGTAIGVSGGNARTGVRFWPDAARRSA